MMRNRTKEGNGLIKSCHIDGSNRKRRGRVGGWDRETVRGGERERRGGGRGVEH